MTRSVRRTCRLVAGLALAGIGASCQSNFEPGSTVNSFRIFAVQKDKPYARPGDTVHLTMLLDDGGTYTDGGPRHDRIQIAWAGGCENPPGDAYSQCFTQVLEKARRTGNLPLAFASVFNQGGFGLEFDLTLHDDIISSRPPPANPAQPKYGSSFVFFAACAGGTIDRATDLSSELPLVCKTASGKLLGPDRFVIGYTEVFAYEKFTNANPAVTGFEVDGKVVEPDCIGQACVALEHEEFKIVNPPSFGSPRPDAGATPPSSPDAGTNVRDASTDAGTNLRDASTDGGAPGPAAEAGAPPPGAMDAGSMSPSVPPPGCVQDPKEPRCFDVCTTGDRDKCPKHTVKLILDKSKLDEHDQAQEAISGGSLGEQMWINYYTDAGKLEREVKLLNDATTGYNENHAADLRAPLELAPFHVWAVAHDNRGGAQWARVTLSTRVPASGFP